jgi:hypothetical protein
MIQICNHAYQLIVEANVFHFGMKIPMQIPYKSFEVSD